MRTHRPPQYAADLPGRPRREAADAAYDADAKRFYKSPAWRKLARAFRNENPLCAHCNRSGRVKGAEHVDHIVARRIAPELELDPSNLQPLCTACHRRKTNYEAAAIEKSGLTTLPPAHARGRKYFDQVYCVNLPHRRDRHDEFFRQVTNMPGGWPWHTPTCWPAVDGTNLEKPAGWNTTPGALGCYFSHLGLIRAAYNSGHERILVFEDDAAFGFDPTWPGRARDFVAHLPDNWQLAYLGGRDDLPLTCPTIELGRGVAMPTACNRTHAYAINGGQTLKRIAEHLARWELWPDDHHVDRGLVWIARQAWPELVVYRASPWLVGQAAGASDVAGRNEPARDWNAQAHEPGPPTGPAGA